MSRRIVWIVAVWLGLCATALPGHAARKLAFIVGNSAYDNLGAERSLPRATSDAAAIAATLQDLDYAVASGNDLTRSAFNALWQKFLDDVSAGDTVTIFFSGHGVQIGGENFLLPRDIPRMSPNRQEQIRREALSLAEMLLDLGRRKPRVTVVLLDACRDNPFVPAGTKSAAAPGGLASVSAPSGTFIMFAAGDGETALERLPPPPGDTNPTAVDRDPHSLYTRKLLPMLRTPGLTLPDMARRIRDEVRETAAAAGHAQRPAYYDNLDGRFCFAGCAEGGATAARPAPGPSPVPSADTEQARKVAKQAWQDISGSTDVAALQSFIDIYDSRDGGQLYVYLALQRIKTLEAEAKTARAKIAALQPPNAAAAPRPPATVAIPQGMFLKGIPRGGSRSTRSPVDGQVVINTKSERLGTIVAVLFGPDTALIGYVLKTMADKEIGVVRGVVKSDLSGGVRTMTLDIAAEVIAALPPFDSTPK